MPHVEVVPTSTSSSATPGWAYVPDTGYDPSKAPIQPSGARKRAAREVNVGSRDNTARQNNAIIKHLAELDKDNYHDAQIPVPVRQRDAAGRVSKGKVTQAVRRILMSQKTFANHLGDEEAALANQSAPAPTPVAPPAKVAKTSSSRAKRASTSASVEPSSAQTTPATQPQAAAPAVKPITSSEENDPLLKSIVPIPPSAEELQALVSAPPLSYNAARVAPSSSDIPNRHFCEICGYWGRIRCMKCGTRVCGLDCKGVHDEGRCLRFYA